MTVRLTTSAPVANMDGAEHDIWSGTIGIDYDAGRRLEEPHRWARPSALTGPAGVPARV